MSRVGCLVGLLLLIAACSIPWAAIAAWDPSLIVGQQFQYQLGEKFAYPQHVLPGVKVYFVDLFETTVGNLTNMLSVGLVPVCYFSTQYEDWREDASQFRAADIGNALDGWQGENWVDIRSTNVRNIMKQRIARCRQKGFLAIDPDNTDGYTADSGFPLTASDALDFLTFLSNEARAQGLGIGLKNTLDLINPTNVALWDFAVNEQCYQYSECNMLLPFTKVGKPVFNVEYTTLTKFNTKVCPKAASLGITAIRKTTRLAFKPRDACPNSLLISPSAAAKSSPSPAPKPSPSPAPQQQTSNCSQQIAIPSYFYPCTSTTCPWQVAKGKAKLVIINPASGPGTAVDQNYVNTVNEMKAAGMIVLGYTYSQYGARAAADVTNDIDLYYQWYGVSGIFLDEGSNNCDQLAYYQQLVSYIKTKSAAAVVVLNPGTDFPECYLSSANAPDIVINFENTYDNYLTWAGPQSWTANYPASKFWHLVHSTPATPEAFTRALMLSRSRRAGWVYVTDDVMANPWDTTPTGAGLWDLEVGMVKSTQQIAVPSYFYPCFTTTSTCYFQRTKGAARLVIINPNSGPGTAVDANYVRIVNETRSSGMLVLAYVATGYAAKSIDVVKAEVDKYYAWYSNIAGIFLDEGSDLCSNVAYYQQVVSYIKTKNPNALTALNWGMNGPECYLTTAGTPDIYVIFENTYNTYLTWTPSAWTASYPASRFWHLVYSTSATTTAFDKALSLAKTRRAGWVYVTSDAAPNPWDTLPSTTLWPREVSTVANSSFC